MPRYLAIVIICALSMIVAPAYGQDDTTPTATSDSEVASTEEPADSTEVPTDTEAPADTEEPAEDSTPTITFNFATNTPRPALPENLNFATNTPSGPTSTPSATATATHTPTQYIYPNIHTDKYTVPTPTPIGPFFYPEGINPLTGLPYPSADALARRNLLIKVSNFPPVVRPQTGINAADVVYEYEVEGGVTRFAAIYRSTAPELVGPVRSGRLMDIQLVTMYESLFAYSGASGPVQELILSQDWRFQIISPSIGDNCAEAGFCRVERPALHLNTRCLWNRQRCGNVLPSVGKRRLSGTGICL